MNNPADPKSPIRVGIVDDHPYVREGVRAMLQGHQGIEVVGEAANGEEAFALVSSTPLDVLLLDLNMPGKNGIRITRELRERHPKLNVIVLSAYDTPQYIISARRAGAHAYVVKTDPNLVAHIRAVAAGIASIPNAQSLGTAPWDVLTPAELGVARLVAHSSSDKETGVALAISDRTVQAHRANIRRKLRASTPPLNADPVALAHWLADWGELED